MIAEQRICQRAGMSPDATLAGRSGGANLETKFIPLLHKVNLLPFAAQLMRVYYPGNHQVTYGVTWPKAHSRRARAENARRRFRGTPGGYWSPRRATAARGHPRGR